MYRSVAVIKIQKSNKRGVSTTFIFFFQRYNRIHVLRVTRSFHNKVTLCDLSIYIIIVYW